MSRWGTFNSHHVRQRETPPSIALEIDEAIFEGSVQMSVVTGSDNVDYTASYSDANIMIKHVRAVQGPQTTLRRREGLYSPRGFDRCETALLTETTTFFGYQFLQPSKFVAGK
jgi:hypothetical protein